MNITVRTPPASADQEDAWEAPDALGVSGAEAAAKNAPFVRSIWEWIGYPALLTIAWSAGALLAWLTSL